jgi:hypothetical protein
LIPSPFNDQVVPAVDEAAGIEHATHHGFLQLV